MSHRHVTPERETAATLPLSELPTVSLNGGEFYVIRHVDRMPPFFMTVVSSADHWLFLSSTGGLTAGRVDAERALFPYATEDKLTENSENTGPKTILRVRQGGETVRWEPFSAYTVDQQVERHLYKSVLGHAVIFEEIHARLHLRFRYAWQGSERFGLVRTCWLTNLGEKAVEIEVLDGLQNVLPAGATSQITNELSVLLDAYKVSEVDPDTGLGVFTLNATLSDRAEPSESLRANTVWGVNLPGVTHLVSNRQLGAFRREQTLEPETLRRGERGAYFQHVHLSLEPEGTHTWHMAAEVHQDGAQVADLRQWLRSTDTATQIRAIEDDLAHSGAELRVLLARVDGLQVTGDTRASGRHLANTLFNTMRGGLFVSGDRVARADLLEFVRVRNPGLLERHAGFFSHLPEELGIQELRNRAAVTHDPDLLRVATSYLPLTFSRRHGDPSRPWNRFAIRVRRPDGTRHLDYQGNWRDIFQNWEPLAYTHPVFLDGMIATFLNATTADGYNPYRITRQGLDWEEPEPENPWANIGYWSDHQINYLLKLLGVSEKVQPGRLQTQLNDPLFSHAQVPYEIKPYREMLKNWSDTITFNHELNQEIKQRVKTGGSDGRLLRGPDGQILHVSMLEKLLTLLLAKLVNLVPGGGLWMNTQRPEWNDANNALVGKGLSVVTVAYLHRYLKLLDRLLSTSTQNVTLSSETVDWLGGVLNVMKSFGADEVWTPQRRRAFMDGMGEVGSRYRAGVYAGGLSGERQEVSTQTLVELTLQARNYVAGILRENRREDGLYHAYNLLRLDQQGHAHIGHLPEMLEGQVAVLSADFLTPEEALGVLQALRESALFTTDRHSYLLYPDRAVKSFFEKNRVMADQLGDLPLIQAMQERNDGRILVTDAEGNRHFNGDFRNAGDLAKALNNLEAEYGESVQHSRDALLRLFEQVFDHASFTGRSGTFFAYEGLGSIYWHMVAKLLLAAQEQVFAAAEQRSASLPGLKAAYEDIRLGLSYNRSAEQYGAFPTDPYSHTPAHGGARQPGMTGQVKEELLCRPAELGLRVGHGSLHFDPLLLHEREWLREPQPFKYLDVHSQWRELDLPAGRLAFTWCQVPVIVQRGTHAGIRVTCQDGKVQQHAGPDLPLNTAQHLFARDGQVIQLEVTLADPL